MPSSKPSHYRLTPKALDDLDEIWRYTAETWSIDQADRYVDELSNVLDTIASAPMMARERHEFSPPSRIHAYRSHLIVYTISRDHISVLRILGARQNWPAILRAIDP